MSKYTLLSLNIFQITDPPPPHSLNNLEDVNKKKQIIHFKIQVIQMHMNILNTQHAHKNSYGVCKTKLVVCSHSTCFKFVLKCKSQDSMIIKKYLAVVTTLHKSWIVYKILMSSFFFLIYSIIVYLHYILIFLFSGSDKTGDILHLPHIFNGASNSNNIGWLRNISRDFKQRPRISDSVSWTFFPGLDPRTTKKWVTVFIAFSMSHQNKSLNYIC